MTLFWNTRLTASSFQLVFHALFLAGKIKVTEPKESDSPPFLKYRFLVEFSSHIMKEEIFKQWIEIKMEISSWKIDVALSLYISG